MSSPIIPWLPSNIPAEIQQELNRRKTARGLNFTSNTVASWDKDTGDWNKYKGPMSAWARVCSNGWGTPTADTAHLSFRNQKFDFPGMVLYSGEEFYTTYGFGGIINNARGQSILGWTPNGTPHSLVYDVSTSQYPIHVPSPNISKVEATIQKELYRRVNINWTCFSYKQLEYLTPYLLVPGISVIVEWGWNHFNPSSLLDLTDIDGLAQYWDDPYPLYTENILLSRGNYDVIFGIITNFEWSIEGNTIKCNTEITSKDRLYSGISTNSTAVKTNATREEPSKNTNPEHAPEWFTNLTTLCGGNFISSIVALSKYRGKDVNSLNLGASGGGAELKTLCQKLSRQGKESYWRGIFIGRDPSKLKEKKGVHQKDFDFVDDTSKNVWVNMGFIVEIINSCVPIKSISDKKDQFFQVEVDDCPIGAHPNLISTNGSVLLIPNKIAPKYNFNLITNAQSQFLDDAVYNQKNLRGTPDGYDKRMWYADYALSVAFRHGNTPKRDDLDKHINANRYDFVKRNTGKDGFEFPFATQAQIGSLTIPSLHYGYFKDLYINLNEFKNIVNSITKQDSYSTVYEKIFDRLSSAVQGYWDFALVEGSSRDGGGVPAMKVVDNKMVVIRNNDDKPYYFNYGEADSVIQSISFKPALSTAMATRIIFSEQNNKDSKMAISSDGDLLDYQFKDMILSRKDTENESENLQDNNEDRKKAINESRTSLQSLDPPPEGSFPMTFNKSNSNKPPVDEIQHIRLALPNPEFLTMMLNDDDMDNNSRYVGVQPNITAEIRLLGIGGLRTFQMFFIRNLPKPYSEKNIVFRIVDIQQEIENNNWITVIRAGIIPLRGSIKRALGVDE